LAAVGARGGGVAVFSVEGIEGVVDQFMWGVGMFVGQSIDGCPGFWAEGGFGG
jgi:hypothetical protein